MIERLRAIGQVAARRVDEAGAATYLITFMVGEDSSFVWVHAQGCPARLGDRVELDLMWDPAVEASFDGGCAADVWLRPLPERS